VKFEILDWTVYDLELTRATEGSEPDSCLRLLVEPSGDQRRKNGTDPDIEHPPKRHDPWNR
jgi:hypothetical protein